MIDSVRILLRRAPARRPDPSRSCAICAAQDIADPLARHRAAVARLGPRPPARSLVAPHPRLQRLRGYSG